VSSHPSSVVLLITLCVLESEWTRFDDQVTALSIYQAFAAVSRLVWGLSNYLEIRDFSMILYKPGLVVDTLLIPALPSLRSLRFCPMSMLSFSRNGWSCWWASQHLVRQFTPRLLSNAPIASWMTCAMHGLWFLNAGHSIPEASRIDCDSQVIELIEEVSSVVIPSHRLSVSSKWSRTCFKCTTSCTLVGWPLTVHS